MIFYKMNGIGNDYVFIDTALQPVGDKAALARRLSDRNFSVGSDGLVLISPSTTVDAKIEIFNRDGSRAEMCGNAIRCVVKYLYDVLKFCQDVYEIETDAGIKRVSVEVSGDEVVSAEVEMGAPICKNEVMLTFAETEYQLTRISVGNPHGVTFVTEIPNDVSEIGKAFSFDKAFPSGANIEFVKVEAKHDLQVAVYERGSGVTKACGTGATAAAYAAIMKGYCVSPVTVSLPGGKLVIREEKGLYYMMGSAELNFKGEIQKES